MSGFGAGLGFAFGSEIGGGVNGTPRSGLELGLVPGNSHVLPPGVHPAPIPTDFFFICLGTAQPTVDG